MTALNATQSLDVARAAPAKRSLLSRIWPFRRVHHRTFGALKPWRGGNYLRAKADFAPVKDRIWLVIRPDQSGPTHSQEKLYLHIEKYYPSLQPKILRSLLAEYQKVRRAQPQIAWPDVADPAELLKIIPLDAIWLEEGPGHPFVLSYQSELDKDHEFHIFFRNGKLDHVAFEH